MLIEGRMSWSGNERNCFFLNLGQRRSSQERSLFHQEDLELSPSPSSPGFADVSAVSGFDFLDDARALGVVDWDGDGDLDLWVTNRTGPQVRFLRNDLQTDHNFLALKLIGNGSTSNRDAIGARVEVLLKDEPSLKSIQSVRAGGGFLSQSSKWVHFGLGNSQVEQVRIRWPDGEVQQLDQLQVNQRYVLAQGQKPQRQQLRSLPQPLSPSVLPPYRRSGEARIVLASRVRLSDLRYRNLQGKRQRLSQFEGPLLINLWSTSCLPCLEELRELGERQSALRDEGLEVLALSTDQLGEGPQATTEAIQQVLEKVEFPFSAGLVEAKLMEQLEGVYEALLRYHPELPVPTSFLLDQQGRLVIIYKGRVEIDQLLEDLTLLQGDQRQRIEAALPFPGRSYGGSLAQAAYVFDRVSEVLGVEAALELLRDYQDLELPPTADRDRLVLSIALCNVGTTLGKRGQTPRAIELFRQAVQVNPKLARAHNNLGFGLSQIGQTEEAISHYRLALQADPRYARAHYNLALLLEKQKRWDEAAEEYEQYLQIVPDLDAMETLSVLQLRLRRPSEAVDTMRKILQEDPRRVSTMLKLGWILHSSGKYKESLAVHQRAVSLQPNNAQGHAQLGTVLATGGKLALARSHLQRALKLDPECRLAVEKLQELPDD